MSKQIRIGIIGAGGIFRSRHFPGLAKIKDAEVAAICNRSAASGRKIAKEFGIDPDIMTDPHALIAEARAWPGLEGMDLAKSVSCTQSYDWRQTAWRFDRGWGVLETPRHHVVAVDYGAKRNILRSLAEAGCGLGDVVKSTVWLADAGDFAAFNKVYAEYFAADPPARSTVESRLMVDAKVEIEVIAYRG